MSQMLSIGYGQNAPHTVVDMWLVSLGMLTGATGYALLVGHATTLIQSIDYTKRLHREKVRSNENHPLIRNTSEIRQAYRSNTSRLCQEYVGIYQEYVSLMSGILREYTSGVCQEYISNVSVLHQQ